MTDKKQDRADRDHERSEEGLLVGGRGWWKDEEEDERLSEGAHQANEQQDNWENEGGAPGHDPRKTTEQGD